MYAKWQNTCYRQSVSAIGVHGAVRLRMVESMVVWKGSGSATGRVTMNASLNGRVSIYSHIPGVIM